MSIPYNEPAFGLDFDDALGEDLTYLFTNIHEQEPSPPPSPTGDKGKRPAEHQLSEGEASSGAKRHRSPTISLEKSNDSEVAARATARRLWVKERDSAWWDAISSPDCPEEEFRHVFRMSRATFGAICDQVGAALAREDTMLRTAIPVRQRFAVCIWRLATGEPLRQVSKRFALGISTCHKLVLEGCAAIKAVLMHKTVQWPEAPEAAASVAAGFEARSGIPNVVGAMYTTHIPIIAPKSNVAAYFNRRHTDRNKRTSYSVTLQGVVDDTGAFTDVCIGWPGCLSDSGVLERSALYAQRGAAGKLEGRWVAGGAEYPLTDWLLVPYGTHTQQDGPWTTSHHAFNERVDGLRAVARDAFRRFKARWGCLQKRTELKLQDLPVVLGACCVLHNICERAGDFVDDDPEVAAYELFDDAMVAEKPVRSEAAVKARDDIAQKLVNNPAEENKDEEQAPAAPPSPLHEA